jgi:hypothetical protein
MTVHWVDSSQKVKATFGFRVRALCGATLGAGNVENTSPGEPRPDCRDCNRIYGRG